MIFSQIVITYNSEKHIRKCLDSVLEQSVLPDEIIIGDDGSKDNTREILVEYQKKYPDLIQLLFHEKNLGIAENLNTCSRTALGDYIGFLAGDDWLLPEKNKVQFEVIQKLDTRYGLYFSDFLKVFVNKDKETVNTNFKKSGNFKAWISKRLFSVRTFWIKKELFFQVGGFDNNLTIYEDWHFRLKLASITDFKRIPGIFSAYQVHDEGIHKVSKEVHIENMETLLNLLIQENYNIDLNPIRAAIERKKQNKFRAFILDPTFFYFKFIFKINNYCRSLLNNIIS